MCGSAYGGSYFAENFYEFAMAHGIEEAFKVKVYYIYVAFVDYPLRSS